MKWIGQHIYDQISRFRDDVYLEDLSTTTETTALVVDSDGKISKNVTSGVNLANGADNRVVTAVGTNGLNAEANLAFDGTDLSLAGSGKMEFRDTGAYIHSLGTSTLEIVTDTLYVNSTSIRLNGDGASEPFFFMTSAVDDSTGPIFYFQKLRDGDGLVDGDILGKINFTGEDVAGAFENYGSITGSVIEADNANEAGQIQILVANDGTERNGITMTAAAATAAEIDVTIANGAASLTTIAGTLTMGSTAAMGNTGLLTVGAQTGITAAANLVTVGTIGTGVWQGTTIKTAYIGDDQVTEDKLANTLLAEIDANTAKNTAPNVYGTTIKVLPSDFMANDEAGAGKSLQFVDNDASGIKPGSASIELLAFVCVPEGMKVTLVDVYAGSALAVDVIVVDINASVSDISAASIGSGNANTQINVTDTDSTATNYFMIQVTTTATSNRVYGALLTIAAQ